MTAYRVATRYSLLVLAKNRLAMVLLVGFIPLWISLGNFVFTHAPIGFRYRATGEVLRAGGEKITMISGSLNAVTLLLGFAMFSVAHRASAFDQRLIAAGYSRLALLMAKLTTMAAASLVVGSYATAWMLWYWPAQQPLLMGIGVSSAAFLYGAIGLFLALFLPGELEGMVTIIMSSMIDLALQNPIASPAANADLIHFLPSYGAMQTCIGAGFTNNNPWQYIALTGAWATGFAMVALAAFSLHTRIHPPRLILTPKGALLR